MGLLLVVRPVGGEVLDAAVPAPAPSGRSPHDGPTAAPAGEPGESSRNRPQTRGSGPRGRDPGDDVPPSRYPFRSVSTPNLMFADDNSAYRRAARREAEAQAAKDRRREEIIATLRRLRDEARDEELQRARERARRHAALLDRYPPIAAKG